MPEDSLATQPEDDDEVALPYAFAGGSVFRRFGRAGAALTAAIVPLFFGFAYTEEVNGVVVAHSDPFAAVCGALAVALGLMGLVAARHPDRRERRKLLSDGAAVLLGAYHLASGTGLLLLV